MDLNINLPVFKMRLFIEIKRIIFFLTLGPVFMRVSSITKYSFFLFLKTFWIIDPSNARLFSADCKRLIAASPLVLAFLPRLSKLFFSFGEKSSKEYDTIAFLMNMALSFLDLVDLRRVPFFKLFLDNIFTAFAEVL